MLTDEVLFREWQEGSAGALEALVRRHHAPLLAHLYRLTGDRTLAEDLTQETFFRLVREGHRYRYPRPFMPWFYTIARNLARNHWQSAYHRHVAVGDELPAQQAMGADPAEWLERHERRSGVRAALMALTLEQREVLSLHFDRELSVSETAAILGLPPGTVKSRTFAALHRLRALLEEDERGVGGAPDPDRRVDSD